MVALDDSSTPPLLSRFFPKKARRLIQLMPASKNRLYYRSSEVQRDRSRVSRIIRAAVPDLKFKALWSVTLTFQSAEARGKMSRDQREVSACCMLVCFVVLCSYTRRRMIVTTGGNSSQRPWNPFNIYIRLDEAFVA